MTTELRRQAHPGKYEGGLVIDEAIHQLSTAGCDDEAGDISETGEWYGMLKGPFRSEGPFGDISATMTHDLELTPDELTYLASVAGAIVREDDLGFVTVEYFDDPAALDEAWAAITA